jgi:phosphomannomutase/phosphoglucomutase
MFGKGIKVNAVFNKTVSSKGESIQAYVRNVALSLILIVVLFGAVWFLLHQLGQKQIAMDRAVEEAETVVGRLSEQIHLYRGLLQSVARESGLAELFLAGDPGRLARKERDLQQRIPGAMRVHLLPPRWDNLQSEPERQLSFAALTMLRAAEQSDEVTVAEIHQLNTPQQHIAMAVRVVDEANQVVGVIYLTLPINLAQRSLNGITDINVEIRQVAGNQAVRFAGNGDAIDDDGTGRIPVSGTIWSVVFQPIISTRQKIPMLELAVPVVGLVLMVVLLLLFAGRLTKALREDRTTIEAMAGRLARGRPVRSQMARMTDLQATFDRLVQMGQEIVGNDEPRIPVPKAGHRAAPALPAAQAPVEEAAAPAAGTLLPAAIFRAYDIRGVVDRDLTPETVYQLGRAIGSEAYDRGQQTIIVGRDGRLSGPALCAELCRGLMAAGRDVVDIGVVPTPVLYFATHQLGSGSGVVLTGSHNPPEYNGLKVVIGGETLSGETIQSLRRRLQTGNLLEGDGLRQERDLLPDYVERITGDVQLVRPLKVVVDCGNGAAGVIAPALYKALGCKVSELYCEVDGKFPNHHPDPGRPENLQALIREVKSQQADIGLAFDGDGDRLGVVDSTGKIIWPDRLLMLFARDVLSRQPGTDIIYDVKSSRHLAGDILSHGGRPLMWKTGHSLIKAKMVETGALLAGELSGHIFFKERWYGFDDGIYAGARLLEILAADSRSSAEVFEELPESASTPELSVAVPEGAGAMLVEKLVAHGAIPGAKLVTIDGVRAEFEHGWGLVRPSNTTPALIFRFEADDARALSEVQARFRQLLLEIQPDLKLPF